MTRKTNISLPEKPNLEGLEAKWGRVWEETGVYRFDRSKSREDIFSIDTPPPTVSGALHIGHCFSYTHTDLIARFQRMSGREVFYPMGWDDNGLNTERRVQKMLGIKCDPSLPYDPNFTPPREVNDKSPIPVSRPNFVEQCKAITEEMEAAYLYLWSTLGLSVDWSMTYTSIGERARLVSQRGFMRLFQKGLLYSADQPALWEIDYKTGVAQAEIEDRETNGAFHRIAFHKEDDSGDVLVDTTRPELIAANVAVFVNPDDERFNHLAGTTLINPLYGTKLPVYAHTGADPEKGTGVVMVSTWGDMSDVEWWKEIGLPTRVIVGEDGRLRPVEWGSPNWESVDAEKAAKRYSQLVGKRPKEARKIVVELLRESGELIEDPKPISHAVKFWENGDNPLEIVPRRQWYIKVLDDNAKRKFLERGQELTWHPDYMKVRYENWVNGLNQDWNISRQRFFGVPFPVWYKIDADGYSDYDNPILPEESQLPIDPSSDVPPGYIQEQRGAPNGFRGDPDVMDTWATSSMTPAIVTGWVDDDELFQKTFPMDMRPQAHEIIRTWLFYSVVRSQYEFEELPWKHAAISGFVVDPDRKKISKSKGNAQDQPIDLISQYGADAVRYWAANAAPGLDCPLDHNQFKIGRRLSTKLLNASKFVLGLGLTSDDQSQVTAKIDAAMLGELAQVIRESTDAFNAFNYAKALERIEAFFWNWCDNYLELAKTRAYGSLGEEKANSAKTALAIALSVQQRLFAPFLSYTTEEVWSWWQDGSIHKSAWPQIGEFAKAAEGANPELLQLASDTLASVRKAKSDAKLSMKAAATQVTVKASAQSLELLREAEDDLREAGVIEKLAYEEGEPEVIVVLADQ